VYGIANSFERKVLLEYALKSYQLASGSDEDFNFNKIGLLYGQMANMEMMIATFWKMPIPILKTPSESKPTRSVYG
jgi:hypothetical protein